MVQLRTSSFAWKVLSLKQLECNTVVLLCYCQANVRAQYVRVPVDGWQVYLTVNTLVCDVKAGEELYLHYGERCYLRDYLVGSDAPSCTQLDEDVLLDQFVEVLALACVIIHILLMLLLFSAPLCSVLQYNGLASLPGCVDLWSARAFRAVLG